MTYQINVAPNGRMSLPAEVRNRLGLSGGGALLVEETSGRADLANCGAIRRPCSGARAEIHRRPAGGVGRRLPREPPSGKPENDGDRSRRLCASGDAAG